MLDQFGINYFGSYETIASLTAEALGDRFGSIVRIPVLPDSGLKLLIRIFYAQS